MKLIIAGPVILILIYRAWSRKSLTSSGIWAAAATAVVHALHPWSVFLAMLVVFYMGGTTATKVKHDFKSRLTLSASGSPGGEGPRNHLQVLANSAVASVLILLHARQLYSYKEFERLTCWAPGDGLLVTGIVANYAAVAADTFSSELGILSTSQPRLITSLSLRRVPPGTNGGVTPLGILAGCLGSLMIAITAVSMLPVCGETMTWTLREKCLFVLAVTGWGCLGSLLDSFLGGYLQASVVDLRTGKIVEGDGGRKVLIASKDQRTSYHQAQSTSLEERGDASRSRGARIQGPNQDSHDPEVVSRMSKSSRKIVTGSGLIDNNAVNFLMALIMSIGAIVLASWVFGASILEIFRSGYTVLQHDIPQDG